MSVKYRLVVRKNLGKDSELVPQKLYAQIVSGDLVTFDEFIEEVADSSGVGSAGVKAVLDRMNVVLVRHLQHGRRVQAGELGNFRLALGSGGAESAEVFDPNMIREPRVRFFPGKALRTIKGQAVFEKVALPAASGDDTGGSDGDKPSEL
ncbi:HU family DNA-binding protein [Parabacteroides sp. APC149_11_2_Y6]